MEVPTVIKKNTKYVFVIIWNGYKVDIHKYYRKRIF